MASNTLAHEVRNTQHNNFRQFAIERWNKANKWVQKNIDNPVDWQSICQINTILMGHETLQLRKDEAYLGELRLPEVRDLVFLKESFFDLLLGKENNNIYRASLAYFWLVNCHFFQDANGRTARIIVDWLLSKEGLPPVTYNKFEAVFVAGATQETAYKVILCGIENSLNILIE